MIRLKLKNSQAPTVDEAAKWRSTSFNTELTEEELQRLVDKHGADLLGAHYDDGVPTGKERDTSAAGAPVRSREKTEPQKSFNPKASWETPVGIYYYPMSWAKDEMLSRGVPFAGDKKYIYIYKIRDASKRIDATELCKNGFIERAVLWASVNKDLSRVLKDSGLGGGTTYNELMAYHGGRVTYGDPSKAREENVLAAYKTYFSRAKEAIKTHFTRRIITATANPLGFDWTEIIETLVRDLPHMAGRGLYDMVTWDVKYLPSPFESRQMWSDVARRVLKQLKIEDAIKGLDSTIDAKNPRFEKALETVDNLIDNFISSIPNDQLLKKTQLSGKADKPMPDGSIEKLIRSDGRNTATVANICFYIINNMMDRNVAKVTKYFINQGYEVLEDKEGTGTIHTSEAFQGVYLTTRIIELIGVYLNRNRAGRMKGSYIPAKEMDPKLLRKLLSGEKGKAVVDQAFKYAKDHPEEFNMFLTYMFRNPDIPKDKALADRIMKEVDPERISYNTIGSYITNFANLLTPQDLEDRLSKLVTERAKRVIADLANSSPEKIIDTIKDPIEDLDIEYGSKFDINIYPTLKFLKDAVDKATASEKEQIAEKYSKSQSVTTESRFKKLNRIGRYSMLR